MEEANRLLIQVLTDFRQRFERLFEISQNGSLRANWARLQEIDLFVNQQNLLILQSTGLQFNAFNFQQPYRGDIATSNANKTKLLQVYAVCFSTYVKVCSTLKVPTAHNYHLFTSLDHIIDTE